MLPERGEKPPFPDAFYLLELAVRNVRCFGPEEQVLRLRDTEGRPAPWTVILGDNGVGKTTLLQCLVALEPRRQLLRSMLSRSLPERPLVDLPIGGSETWRIYRDPERPRETTIWGLAVLADGAALTGRFTELDRIVVPTNSEQAQISMFAPESFLAQQPSFRLEALRCCAYGATRKMGSDALSRKAGDPAASLFADDVPLVDAEEWLLVEDYARTRRGDAGSERRLQRVRQVFLDLLPDVADLRIRESGGLKPAIEVKTPYGWVQLSDLSLGYRTMVAWTVDLASRLFERYPESKNPLAEPAIVLVDEVDLHLHPKWQRELREHLVERFPNTQFVVTAHSPLVVQASENENIVVLRRKGDSVVIDNDVETVRGWRVDQVLTSDLFGLRTARPPEYDAVISERNALLNQRSLGTEDRAKLASLEAQITRLPAGETPEDAEAMEIIRQAAAKLSNR